MGSLSQKGYAMPRQCSPDENERIVRRFLSLPMSSMPSAIAIEHDDDARIVWNVLRDYVSGRTIPTNGYRVYLSADRKDWVSPDDGNSIIVELNDDDPRCHSGWNLIDTSI